MRLFALHAGGETNDLALLDPLHPDVGTKVDVPYLMFVIEHPQGRVLFDSGAHPDLPIRLKESLAAGTAGLKIGPNQDAVSLLSTLDLVPSDISYVCYSHLHYDHCGGTAFFPDATFLVQRRELEYAHWPPVHQRTLYMKEDFDYLVRWHELRGEYDVFGDGQLVLFPTPGHTPGHQSLLVRLGGGPIILAGDAAYMTRNMALRNLPATFWNADEMVESWERIEAIQERERAIVWITHDLDYRERRLGPDQWYE